ncbi:MAG: NifB/NifX family molybdenum-iron cluster-binding protein, partial [Thermoguttaceae bacterium]|nr:NifB/NifX family molybdenum-iron cluster-binding protein [Thermoguttaceae bacterium]
MKIAVPFDNGQIFGHFGQTQTFKIYETDGSQVVSTQTLAADGYAHCALANLLAKENVDALICGGIGGGALAKLNAAGIKFYAGVSGDADAAVAALLAGE